MPGLVSGLRRRSWAVSLDAGCAPRGCEGAGFRRQEQGWGVQHAGSRAGQGLWLGQEAHGSGGSSPSPGRNAAGSVLAVLQTQPWAPEQPPGGAHQGEHRLAVSLESMQMRS